MSRRNPSRAMRLGVVVLMAVAVTAGCSEDRDEPGSTGTTTEPQAVTDCAANLLECARATIVGDHVPDEATEADGEPIVLGMINQENTPLGSYPELSSAAKAGAELVNRYLGGVDGRPIEIEVCNTEFSPEGSTACGQGFAEDGVPAVLGGIDVFGNGIATLADNGIPYVGGIPVSASSVATDTSFQFSGGIWGATIAFAQHAADELGAERVAIAHPEFDTITDAAQRGKRVLEEAGVTDVQLIPYPITATDLTSPLQAAAAADPDALIMLAADTGCEGTFAGVDQVGLDAQLYLVGACATPAIIEAAGPEATEGTIFNVEGEVDTAGAADPDTALYVAAADELGDGFDPIGAGTVTFRSFMNLWSVLVGLDEVTPEAIVEAFRAKVDEPSFMGHPYTCDGDQLDGLPAICSPQQVLVQMTDGALDQLGGWVDVGSIPGA